MILRILQKIRKEKCLSYFVTCNPNVNGIRHTEYSFGYKNVWESDVEVGAWQIVIPTNKGLDENGEIDTIGIGGDNVPYVYFGHICGACNGFCVTARFTF